MRVKSIFGMMFGVALTLMPAMVSAQDPHETEMFDESLYGLVEARLAREFGEAPSVFHELVSDVIHLDLIPLAPNAGRDFWVVSTIGMSFKEMSVPASVEDAWFWKRAELMIALPGNWPGLDKEKGVIGDDTYFYPLKTLKETARFPFYQDTAIAPTHTIKFVEPLGPGSEMDAVLIWWPDFLSEGAATIDVVPEKVVNLLQVIPIYEIEREYAVTNGSEALYDLLKAAGATKFYDLTRKPVVDES